MNSDDLTRPTTNDGEDDKDTQPTITAVFRLLREVKQDVADISLRLDGINSRLDTTDSRLNSIDRRLDAIELRVTEGFRGLSNKLDALNKSRLQAEGDHVDLVQRVTELESKAT